MFLAAGLPCVSTFRVPSSQVFFPSRPRQILAQRMSGFVTNMCRYDVTAGITRSEVIFFPTAKVNGVFSPDKLRCVSVRVAGAGSGGRFRKVPESSVVCWCRFRRRVPEGSGGFRHMLVKVSEAGSGRFRRVPL